MRIATPKPNITTIGSTHEFVERMRMRITTTTAIPAIRLISLTVLSVATAVLTALPVIALSSPITSLIFGTAELM